jgi:lipoprotein-anchoring transpeptidase ErfK/SrfK
VNEKQRLMTGSTGDGQRSGRRWTWGWPVAIALLAALIPAVPIAIGIGISSTDPGAAKATANTFTPNAAGTPSVPTPPPAKTPRHHPQSGVLVALLRHATPMRASPGGKTLAKLTTRTDFGSPQALWVVRGSGTWLGVISPIAGNGHVGWIDRAATKLGRVTWQIKVSLHQRRLTVLDNGKVIHRYSVAVGRPSAPTPTGRFAVTDRLLTGDPTGPYGCCVLALSAHSPHAIQGWNGGDRIAIHSTPETSSIGLPVSHGCLRLTLAEGRWLMAHIPLGTPTLISA